MVGRHRFLHPLDMATGREERTPICWHTVPPIGVFRYVLILMSLRADSKKGSKSSVLRCLRGFL